MAARRRYRNYNAHGESVALIREEDEGCFGYVNTCCRKLKRDTREASYCGCFNLCLYFLILCLSGLLTFLLIKRDVPLIKFGKDEKCDASSSTNASPLLSSPQDVTTTTTTTTTTIAPKDEEGGATTSCPPSSTAAAASPASSSSVSSNSPFVRLLFLSSNALEQGQYALAIYILENFNFYGQPATTIVCLRDFHISELHGKCAKETTLQFSGKTLEQCQCECERYRCATFSHKDSVCEVHTAPCVPEAQDPGWKTFTIDGLKFLQINGTLPTISSTSGPATGSSSPAAKSTQAATINPASTTGAASDNVDGVDETDDSKDSKKAKPNPASSAAPSSAGKDSDSADGVLDYDNLDSDLDFDLEDLDGLDFDDLFDEEDSTAPSGAQPAGSSQPPATTQNPSQPAANPANAQLGIHRRLLKGKMDGDLVKNTLTFFFDSYWTDEVALPAGPPPQGLPNTIFLQMIKDTSEELHVKIPSSKQLKQVETAFDSDQDGYISFNEFAAPLSPILRRTLGLSNDEIALSKQ